MNLVDQLLENAKTCAENSVKLKQDIVLYQRVIKALPRLFPAPDDLYIRTPDIDADVVLVYILKDKEQDEALRMILSVTFGMYDWEYEIDKSNFVMSLVSVNQNQGLSILLKIVGADKTHYVLTQTKDIGLKFTGRLECIKFIPWECLRPDITPDVLIESCSQSNVISYVSKQQAKILNELASVLPKLPAADGVAAGLGMDQDAEITYACDPIGKKRSYIDKKLGYHGWAATIDKETGDFDLHTFIDVKCDIGTLRLRITILDACKAKEILFLTDDTDDVLVYRAVRTTDPDYDTTKSHDH